MLAASRNFDVVCLQMRNNFSDLELSLQMELNGLMTEIRNLLITGIWVKSGIDALLQNIFNFRIKAIKWMAAGDETRNPILFDEIYQQLENIKSNPELALLSENILFALRCNKRVINALKEEHDFFAESFKSRAENLPAINYDQFLATLAFSVPDDTTTQNMVDWVNASLYIETIILAAVVINDENLKVANSTIHDLALLIAGAAQNYYALAAEIGILKSSEKEGNSLSENPDDEFMDEQKFLSDLGISDFAANF